MKTNIFFLSLLLLQSCSNINSENASLSKRVDSLEKKLATTYKPGFGEFMSGIQVHHEKLWFAGTNENWDLADFEIHEIVESLDDIKMYQSERPETKSLAMLNPALDSMNLAIKNKNEEEFKRGFVFLTNACNNCHKEVNYSFNEIRIPTTPPFSNQTFQKIK